MRPYTHPLRWQGLASGRFEWPPFGLRRAGSRYGLRYLFLKLGV
jgi:hypothetical protein